MKIKPLFFGLAIAACATNVNAQTKMNSKPVKWASDQKPPVPMKKPSSFTAHGDTRVDDYYWMIDFFKKGPDSANVVNYLNEENNYFNALTAGTHAFQEKLYKEMRSRIKEKDETLPYLSRGYYYYSRLVEGKDYFAFCRKKGSLDATEEVLLDVNAMAEGHEYYSATGFAVSLDNNLMAFAVDTVSRRQYDIYVKDLRSGQIFKDKISLTDGDPVWAADNKTFFYTAKNPVTLLSEKILRHTLGTDASSDVIVYEEKDKTNYISVGRTRSDKFITISSGSTLTSEVFTIDASRPADAPKLFQQRQKDVLYYIDHANDRFYIQTNHGAKNFMLVTAEENATEFANWKTLIAHDPQVLLQGFEVFRNYLVVSERKNGLTQLRIQLMSNNETHYLAFDETAYAAGIGANAEYNTDILRFNYNSLTTPASVYDYDMKSRTKKLMKQQEVIGSFKPSDYQTERLYATATDGTKIPISIVYRKGFNKNGNAPLLLYGYGSYGATMDASFSSVRLSLLDRGFAFAIAHIRGGQEMGRYWYEDGKMFKKKNTFTDFIACAEFLIANKYTSTNHLYANGGSAGGLLMGAIANMRPDLWKGIIAAVPFVDVINTMSDPTIPLTTNEYDEWGNPANKESYFYMKSYSPYDNVERKGYPNMLVTTGLHDSQVQYFEPAKWVAKLRELKTDNNKILLYTNMDAGHGGASGRFKSLKDRARDYAFLFLLEGITD